MQLNTLNIFNIYTIKSHLWFSIYKIAFLISFHLVSQLVLVLVILVFQTYFQPFHFCLFNYIFINLFYEYIINIDDIDVNIKLFINNILKFYFIILFEFHLTNMSFIFDSFKLRFGYHWTIFRREKLSLRRSGTQY